MGKHVAFLIFGLVILEHAISLETSPKIAVIGGGIGGATASHFLTELTNGNLDIDLFESRRIGGRLATVKVGNEEYEAGGSIIHPKNMYMKRFVELLGLEHMFLDKQYMGIWNGDEFVFKDDSYIPITWMKLVYRYGFQAYKLERDINDMLDKFMKIYKLQDAGMSFANITTLLSAIYEEFPKRLQMSMKDRFLQMGYSKKVIDELIKTAIVVNYGQDTDIQSFVGCVSLAADSNAWSVKNGNKGVPEQLIRRNKNVSVVSAHVTKIRYIGNGDKRYQYEVTFSGKDDTGTISTDKYDIVIIAVPLTSDQESPIKFVNFPEDLEFPGSYHTVHTTFVKADIKPEYFGLREGLDILSCNPNKTKINSMARQNPVDKSVGNDSPVWKIFSNEPLGKDLIRKMFSNIIEEKTVVWKAFPHYSSTTRHNSFRLHDAMYHVNAIEWVASAMEMSAIGGRNVAILAYNDFLQKHGLASAEEVPNIPKKVFYKEEM